MQEVHSLDQNKAKKSQAPPDRLGVDCLLPENLRSLIFLRGAVRVDADEADGCNGDRGAIRF